MLKAYQLDKMTTAPLLIAALALPLAGSAVAFIDVDPTSDANTLAAVTGQAYTGGDLPLVPAVIDTSEGYVVGDIVQLLDPATRMAVNFESNELYARLTQDGTNMRYSFYTNVDGVETAATIDADSVGVAALDFVLMYHYHHGNLKHDAFTKIRRAYISQDGPSTSDVDVTYHEKGLAATANDTLPMPAFTPSNIMVGVTPTSTLEVFVNGKYEPSVTFDGVNPPVWDPLLTGYTLLPDADVTYVYAVSPAVLAALPPSLTIGSMYRIGFAPIHTDETASFDNQDGWSLPVITGDGAQVYAEDVSSGGGTPFHFSFVATPASVAGDTATYTWDKVSLEVGSTYDVRVVSGGSAARGFDTLKMASFGDAAAPGATTTLTATSNLFAVKVLGGGQGTIAVDRFELTKLT